MYWLGFTFILLIFARIGPEIIRKLHVGNGIVITPPSIRAIGIIIFVISLLLELFSWQVGDLFLFFALFFATLNAWNDWYEQEVFDILNFALIGFASLYWLVAQYNGPELVMLVILNTLLAVFAWKTTSIRSGDILYVIGCSLLVGSEQIIRLMVIASLLGGLYGFYLLIRKKFTWETTIAFTPFILLATIFILK
ncbi:MAG: hypothetical protein ACRC5Q_01230 [Culicoidibacterales bacterium]